MSVTITIRENGPYFVEGDFKLVDAQGQRSTDPQESTLPLRRIDDEAFLRRPHSKMDFKGDRAVEQSSK